MNTFLAVASAALIVLVFHGSEVAGVDLQSILRSKRSTEVDDGTSAELTANSNTKCLEYNMTRIIGGKISCVLTLTRGDYVITPDVGAFKIHHRETTWHNARKICLAEGGQLAVMDTSRKHELFQKWKQQHDYFCIWLGFHDLFEEGTWLTVTGESIDSIGYYPWAEDEPSGVKDRNQDTDCGAHWSNGVGDFPCNNTCDAFICEINVCEALGHRVR